MCRKMDSEVNFPARKEERRKRKKTTQGSRKKQKKRKERKSVMVEKKLKGRVYLWRIGSMADKLVKAGSLCLLTCAFSFFFFFPIYCPFLTLKQHNVALRKHSPKGPSNCKYLLGLKVYYLQLFWNLSGYVRSDKF